MYHERVRISAYAYTRAHAVVFELKYVLAAGLIITIYFKKVVIATIHVHVRDSRLGMVLGCVYRVASAIRFEATHKRGSI